MFIIFLIWTICKRVSLLKYALMCHLYHKNYCEKNGCISWMLCLFSMGPSKLKKKKSFNLTIVTEGITQLLKSNFEQSIRKWRHQCHVLAKEGIFFFFFFFFFEHIHYLPQWYLIIPSSEKKIAFFRVCFHGIITTPL